MASIPIKILNRYLTNEISYDIIKTVKREEIKQWII